MYQPVAPGRLEDEMASLNRTRPTSSARLGRSGFDRSSDTLWSRQELRWLGREPAQTAWTSLPDVLLSAHFGEVERALGGVLRCRHLPDRTVCLLPGGVTGLVFERHSIATTESAVVVTLRIGGGVLARSSKSYGTLQLGVSRRTIDGGATEFSAWQEVEGYPSRFLLSSRILPVGLAAGIIGGVYRSYHSHVSFRSLDRIRAYLKESAMND